MASGATAVRRRMGAVPVADGGLRLFISHFKHIARWGACGKTRAGA